MVPTARTVSPSWADDMWLPLTCIPTQSSSGWQRIIEPSPATVSASANVAPPCRMPKGLTGPLVYRHSSLYPVFGSIGILNAQISHQGMTCTLVQLVERNLCRTNLRKNRFFYGKSNSRLLHSKPSPHRHIPLPNPEHCPWRYQSGKTGSWKHRKRHHR